MNKPSEDSSSSESRVTILATSDAANTTFLFERGRSGFPSRRQSTPKEMEKAVYGFIRAVRALGRTSVASTEISDALNLSARDVEGAMRKLGSQGVRIIK